MYQSIEAIEKLRKEKINVLESVYSEMNMNAVYQKQTLLNSMSINIYTDATSAIIGTLDHDGVSKRVLPRISGRLEELKFKSVPAESVIDEAYNQSIRESQKAEKSKYTYVTDNNTKVNPERNRVINIKGKYFPLFLTALIAQGIAVPILINGASVLVKVLVLSANGVAMSVEVLKYYQYQKKAASKRRQTVNNVRRTPNYNTDNPESVRDDMKRQAIFQVYKDNLAILNRWFDQFAEITKQEIERELAK